LKIDWLIKNGYLVPNPKNKYAEIYKPALGMMIYSGQHDEKGAPEGIVRFVWPHGTIYEG